MEFMQFNAVQINKFQKISFSNLLIMSFTTLKLHNYNIKNVMIVGKLHKNMKKPANNFI